ncbi:centromere protein H-like [Gigantopelta aegis]|uniref:centromere protein H-like n=1 Tax=Gigantopelta aegis TaxID=1735272 RepID=UPI001B88D49A|nr:centromere protein H-like [Gigantopelta aegis]XP_041361808.1 centromere protein H-like [Gigantopelta aegis]
MSTIQPSESNNLNSHLSEHAEVDENISDASSDVPSVVTVTDLLKVHSWLDRQLYDYNSQIVAAEIDSEETDDLEKLQENLSVLQNDLVTEASRASLRDLTIKRLQLGQTLNQILTSSPDSGEEPVYQTDPVKKEVLEELLIKQRDLVSQTVKKSEVVQELKDSLANIKKANFELKVNNRKLMAIIKERHSSLQEQAKSFSKNEKGQNMKTHLQKLVDKIVIQRQVLKGVILGSGVNWQQDPTMRERVIRLGEPLDI